MWWGSGYYGDGYGYGYYGSQVGDFPLNLIKILCPFKILSG